MKKNLLKILGLGALAFGLIACSTQTKQSGESKTDMTKRTSEASSSNVGETASKEASKTEDLGNALTLYCSMTDDDVDTVLEGFNKLYPDINVEVVNGSAGELFARLQAEAANPQGDVMLGGMNQADGDKYKDISQKYRFELKE